MPERNGEKGGGYDAGGRWFFVRLIALAALAAAVLFLVWNWRGRYWFELSFREVSFPLYRLVGLEPGGLMEGFQLVLPRFVNVIPFLALMIAVPGISWRRRTTGAVAGFGILLVWHMILAAAAAGIHARWGLGRTAYMWYSPLFLLSDALPFLLWFVIARRPLLTRLFPRRTARSKESAERPPPTPQRTDVE